MAQASVPFFLNTNHNEIDLSQLPVSLMYFGSIMTKLCFFVDFLFFIYFLPMFCPKSLVGKLTNEQ